jgi:hypothetical protein
VSQLLERGVSQQVFDITPSASEEVVNAEHVTAVGEQPFTKMRPQEPGSAGDQNALFKE